MRYYLAISDQPEVEMAKQISVGGLEFLQIKDRNPSNPYAAPAAVAGLREVSEKALATFLEGISAHCMEQYAPRGPRADRRLWRHSTTEHAGGRTRPMAECLVLLEADEYETLTAEGKDLPTVSERWM